MTTAVQEGCTWHLFSCAWVRIVHPKIRGWLTRSHEPSLNIRVYPEWKRETSLQRVTDRELQVQIRVVFFPNTFQGVYYAKRNILKIIRADLSESWCGWGCPAGSRSWGEPSTHCREDVTHLALEYLRIVSEELREESGCTMFPCRNCCSQWPGGRWRWEDRNVPHIPSLV